MRLGPIIAVAGLCAAVVACDNMANQPKRLPYELPYGAQANWPALPPPHTIARDDRPVPPPPVTLALLQRGQQRFDIYCAPCHSRTGDGHGMIVERGFPAPPSYYIDRLRQAPVQHFYDVITNGYGIMFPYAARVAPADRWAIAAYIRALQASASAHLGDVPPAERQSLAMSQAQP
jgi:mono/diheme cytochrome c family protein